MNNRERSLAMILGGVLGFMALLYFGNRWVVQPHRELRLRREGLVEEVEKKERQWLQFKRDKADAAKWAKLSLPANPDRASAEYAQMLQPLLRDCGLTLDDFQGPPPQESRASAANQKKAQHTILPFTVRAKGDVASLVQALDSLQRIPVMHRVRTLTVDRLDPKDKAARLGIQMTIEAVIVHGTKNQPTYLPDVPPRITQADALATLFGYPAGWLAIPYATPHAPIRLALADVPHSTDRNFEDLPLRNPFLGLQPPLKKTPPPPPPPEPEDDYDVREFIRLDTIEPTAKEARLRNYMAKVDSPPMRLKSIPGSGFDVFRVTNEDRSRVLVRGKVLRIDARDIYFQVGEDVYGMHFNQTLKDAMKSPLSEGTLEDLELTALVDAEFAKEAEAEKDAKKAPAGRRPMSKSGKKGKGSE